MKNDHGYQLERIRQLVVAFDQGLIPTLKQHEVHPTELDLGSRERYLYFTLAPSINFQRNSPAMWRSAFATWSDAETQYLFFPERVVKVGEAQIRTDLSRHNLGLQRNKHPQIWRTVCQTLHDQFVDDPRILLAEMEYSVPLIISYLESHKKLFPYLNGPKLSNYWLYILSLYTDIQLKNKDQISIIPDTHVIQASIRLGLVSPTARQSDVIVAWRELLAGTEISLMAMHSVLWNWSRNNFQPEV